MTCYVLMRAMDLGTLEWFRVPLGWIEGDHLAASGSEGTLRLGPAADGAAMWASFLIWAKEMCSQVQQCWCCCFDSTRFPILSSLINCVCRNVTEGLWLLWAAVT